MKPMLACLLVAVSCLTTSLRQKSPAEASGLSERKEDISHQVPASTAGGSCFGPNCCVHVTRAEDNKCQIEARCEQDQEPMLEHLEFAFVCQTGESFTFHSLGYGLDASLNAGVKCDACFAPSKSNFAFQLIRRHRKRAGKAEEGVKKKAKKVRRTIAHAITTPEPLELDLSGPVEQQAMDAQATVFMRTMLAEYVPACHVDAAGEFLPIASKCCSRPINLMKAMAGPNAPCGGGDDFDLCTASCFLAVQNALHSTETHEDDAFCEAYVDVESSLSSLLNSVCSRSESGATCSSVLRETQEHYGRVDEIVSDQLGPPDMTTDAPTDDDAPTDAPADGNDASTVAPTPGPDTAASVLLQRRLTTTKQYSAVSGAYHTVKNAIERAFYHQKREDDLTLEETLGKLCTPCFEKVVGAGFSVLDALIDLISTNVVEEKFLEDYGMSLFDSAQPAGVADIRAAKHVLETSLTGVCSRREDGAFCLPEAVEAATGHTSLAQSTSGVATCNTRCGKYTASLALLSAAEKGEASNRAPLFAPGSEQIRQISHGFLLVESGCAVTEEEYCIDKFWAYVEGLENFHETILGWMDKCSTASAGGECGECKAVLEALNEFGCCRGSILRGMILLASRHDDLENWGIVPDGMSGMMDPTAEADAITAAIEKWSETCEEPDWTEGCSTCSKQVTLSVAMPEGVTGRELRHHQFPIEHALCRDISMNTREPLSNIKVLHYTSNEDNVTMVLGMKGESCKQAELSAAVLKNRIEEEVMVFAYAPPVLNMIASPVQETIEFNLYYPNQTTPSNDAAASIAAHIAKAVEVPDSEVTVTASDKLFTGIIHGADAKFANTLGEDLKKEDSELRVHMPDGLEKIDVGVSIVPNEPKIRVSDKDIVAEDGFGPNECVHISQHSDGTCVMTTRGCDLLALQKFEMAFTCVDDADKAEVHSYGHGGNLDGTTPANFETHEVFKTGIRCKECKPPVPVLAKGSNMTLADAAAAQLTEPGYWWFQTTAGIATISFIVAGAVLAVSVMGYNWLMRRR